MFRIPLLVALALAITFGLGTFSAVWALKATIGFGSIALGPWNAFPTAQTSRADPYAKAHRARDGALLFGSAEGLVFRAANDSAGQPLSGGCSYDIVGLTPQARFWTLHATTPDGRPVPVARDITGGLNSWTVLRRPDNSIAVHVAADAQPGNWLAVPPGQPFRLVLTLLDTPTAGSSGVIDLSMPAINRTGCANA
ncbi:hypothetical protein SAMN05892877_101399 [Rhizobium subbaraonis]|uniref:DUF1214 domain-containing protein n=1 Tax=Rhizobium subbaraonis TaxID=908946 RepID=A0A285U0R9_9HYPH|nr:DUF1214 domain-containing protein [Rhizobium subbaraonis]SOC35524.1 hypothetical protein SAMN05892877_101399 [Rhizobium subbaraonis]